MSESAAPRSACTIRFPVFPVVPASSVIRSDRIAVAVTRLLAESSSVLRPDVRAGAVVGQLWPPSRS